MDQTPETEIAPDQQAAPPTSENQLHAKWALTPEAFEKLLKLFSNDRDDAAIEYEVIRRKLVRFFEWRGIDSADARADETIDRMARRVWEGVVIDNVKRYVYGIARLVLLESLKSHERSSVALDLVPEKLRQQVIHESESELRLECFDRCLESLPAENRQLILDYYQEERRAKIELRQKLADQLEIPLNALRIRAHRIRHSLEKCITRCLESQAKAK